MACLSETAEYKSQRCLFFGRGRIRAQSAWQQGSLAPINAISTPVEQLDLGTVFKASQAVSSGIVAEKLIETLLIIALEQAGAERGLMILPRGLEQRIEAEARSVGDKVAVHFRQSLITPSELPVSLLRYVIRTQEKIILSDASDENIFSGDEYLCRKRPRSGLCLPLIKQRQLMGILYLENNLATDVFAANRLAALELIASQAAISLEQARLYAELSHANEELKGEINEGRRAEEALMLEVSTYLKSEQVFQNFRRLPSVFHEVALETAGPALPAVIIAGVLEGAASALEIRQRLVIELCNHLRGRKGDERAAREQLDLANALGNYAVTGTIRGSRRTAVANDCRLISEARHQGEGQRVR